MEVAIALDPKNIAVLSRIIPVRFPDLANGVVPSEEEKEKVELAWKEGGGTEGTERILRMVAEYGEDSKKLVAVAKEYKMGLTTVIRRADMLLEKIGRRLP